MPLPAEEEAVIALARLGDRNQLKKLECDLLTNDPVTVDDLAYNVLPKVKGWFTIRAYFFMLSQDKAYMASLEKYKDDSDSPFGGVYPSHTAVRYLPEVVPRSPFPVIKDLEDPRIPRLAKQWKIWIQRNRLQLESLQPQGRKGLEFSLRGCNANAKSQ